jgi:hypothetical protein
MSGLPRSAKNASVRVNGVVHYATQWDCTPDADELPTDNFEGNGFKQLITGLIGCEVKVEGWFDCSANPYDAPLSLVPGQVLVNLKLYLNTVAGPFWLFPSFQVLTAPMSGVQVKGLLPFSFSGKANGTFLSPTGSA